MNDYQSFENNLKIQYTFVKNIKNNDEVVVNVLENKLNGERILVKYFNGNAEVYKKLLTITHLNLPKVYKVVQSDNKCIVIEEYIDGITIDEMLQIDRYSAIGVRKIIMQLCDVLSVIHYNGIVHRDIKPENIIVNNSGIVKLLDFNISRINKDNQSKDTLMLGTTGFAAPEQYGISETDARSDIYSIGILINVMLTGAHPSKKLCTGKWRRVVNKCTRISPEERYNSVNELVADVRFGKIIVLIITAVVFVLTVVIVALGSMYNKTQNTKSEPTFSVAETYESKTTEPTTEVATEPTTEAVTEVVTEPTTEAVTEVVTEPTTEAATEVVTELATESVTEEIVEATTEAPTESQTLNYSVTLENNVITVSGNGKISKNGDFTEPFITTSEKRRLNGAIFCEGITNIPKYAFVGCGNFMEISIPNTVTEIEEKALTNTGLSKIAIPENVKYLGKSALSGNSTLWDVKLSEGLKTIDFDCFSGCSSLQKIVIPSTVEYIGENCFGGTGIRAIVLNSKLTKLEKLTFVNCKYLRGIKLPESLESIGDSCFAQCYSLKSIIIPPSVTYIGKYCFSSCENLIVYVTPGSYAEQYCIDNKINFQYADSVVLRTVELMAPLTHLEGSDYANDITLEEIILPEDFFALGDYCFYGCINMKKIIIPPSVTLIGENCFLGCDNLTIYVTSGSYAEQYCIDNQLHYEYSE